MQNCSMVFFNGLGKIYKRYGIVVDKTNKDSRWAAHSAVSKWLEEGDKNPKRLPNKICFSPEGLLDNRFFLTFLIITFFNTCDIQSS